MIEDDTRRSNSIEADNIFPYHNQSIYDQDGSISFLKRLNKFLLKFYLFLVKSNW